MLLNLPPMWIVAASKRQKSPSTASSENPQFYKAQRAYVLLHAYFWRFESSYLYGQEDTRIHARKGVPEYLSGGLGDVGQFSAPRSEPGDLPEIVWSRCAASMSGGRRRLRLPSRHAFHPLHVPEWTARITDSGSFSGQSRPAACALRTSCADRTCEARGDPPGAGRAFQRLSGRSRDQLARARSS